MMSNILVYLGAALVVAFVFVMLKNALKDKMAGSDLFGRLEYPLGMISGIVRFLCLLIIIVAVLNAKYISPAEKAKAMKEQQDALGSSFFPSLGEIQEDVFVKSFAGQNLKKYMGFVLIEPGSATGEDLGKTDSIGRRREGVIKEITK